MVRSRLRKNTVDHLQFNPGLLGEQHRLYFKGVYQPNTPQLAGGQKGEPENFYACWMKYRTPDQTRPPKLAPKREKYNPLVDDVIPKKPSAE
jgi:hypothetical protein